MTEDKPKTVAGDPRWRDCGMPFAADLTEMTDRWLRGESTHYQLAYEILLMRSEVQAASSLPFSRLRGNTELDKALEILTEALISASLSTDQTAETRAAMLDDIHRRKGGRQV